MDFAQFPDMARLRGDAPDLLRDVQGAVIARSPLPDTRIIESYHHTLQLKTASVAAKRSRIAGDDSTHRLEYQHDPGFAGSEPGTTGP
jgi:hypothetical protein